MTFLISILLGSFLLVIGFGISNAAFLILLTSIMIIEVTFLIIMKRTHSTRRGYSSYYRK